jgi:hypothetical protein
MYSPKISLYLLYTPHNLKKSEKQCVINLLKECTPVADPRLGGRLIEYQDENYRYPMCNLHITCNQMEGRRNINVRHSLVWNGKEKITFRCSFVFIRQPSLLGKKSSGHRHITLSQIILIYGSCP